MRMRLLVLILILFSVFSAIPGISQGKVEMTVKDRGFYTEGEPVSGVIEISYDEYFSGNSVMRAYIDELFVTSLLMEDFVKDPSKVSFMPESFSYNLIAYGKNDWKEYVNENFYYKTRVSGICGGPEFYIGGQCTAVCGDPSKGGCTPYAPTCQCEFSIPMTSEFNAYINGMSAKMIVNTSKILSPPKDAKTESLIWSELVNINPSVKLSMRKACAGQKYSKVSNAADKNGWFYEYLAEGNMKPVSGTDWRYIDISPFDDSSIDTNRNLYGGSTYSINKGTSFLEGTPGGVYKNGEYQSSPGQVEWNGTTGRITIKGYDPFAIYEMVFLPPNGELLCAWTDSNVEHEQEWNASKRFSQPSGITFYKPYQSFYDIKDFDSMGLVNPGCPDKECYLGSDCCTEKERDYSAVLESSKYGRLSLEMKKINSTLYQLMASTSYRGINSEYMSINLSLFGDALRAPTGMGKHTLSFMLFEGDNELASDSAEITTSPDNDMDGYAEGLDCDDTRINIHPGGKEVCNGLDDDCDGETDEDFKSINNRIGDDCGVGVCSGKIVCTTDGSGVICNSKYSAGQLNEVCSNKKDDDCDGKVDEAFEYDSRGNPVKACVPCENGQRIECGSIIGSCRDGYRVCSDGKWGDCEGSGVLSDDPCNGIDDNCDGIVDNVGAGYESRSSVDATKCGCYGGALPKEESCNGIDDDCDGMADENLERSCGSGMGICTFGSEYCENGVWTECDGVEPEQEVCDNNIDDDCDGDTDYRDSDCVVDSGGFIFYLIGGVMIALIAGFGLFIRIKKIDLVIFR